MHKTKSLITLAGILILIQLSVSAQKISPFGMGIYPERFSPQRLSNVLQQADELKVKWIRMDMEWSGIEPKNGVYNWSPWDWVVDSVMHHGIKMLGILQVVPSWDSSYAPNNDEQRELYGKFVNTIVKRYKGKIDNWEIWNEPNGGSFWRPEPNPADYTKLLKVAYTEAKKANPNCKILAPVISDIDLEFVKSVYENGGGKYFDVFSFHPYPSDTWAQPDVNLVWGVQGIRNIMRTFGEEKLIWISEIGYSTNVYRGVTEPTQASYLVRSYLQSIALGIENIMWYDFRDDGVDIRNHEMSWGVLNYSFIPKPSYYSYKTMTTQLHNLKFEKNLFGNEGQIRGMLFGNNKKKMLALWSIKDIAGLSLNVGVSQVTITDLYGNKSSVECPNDILKLRLSARPIYVSGFTKQPERLGKVIKAEVLQDWLLCGPFTSYKDSGLNIDYLKNKGGEASIEPKLNDEVENDSLPNGQTTWKKYKTDKFGNADLLPEFNPDEFTVAYAFCKIKSNEDRTAILDVSSDDGNEVWINHKPVQYDHEHRKLREGEHLVTVKLHKGENSCLMKIENRAGGWGFYLRVLGN